MSARPPAPLVYVMGPSGAGKDTLLREARAALAGSDILFAHRYITRAPVPGDENFISLSDAEFTHRAQQGLFAFDWQAHGVRYGIGSEIVQWRHAGAVVVVSGSRAHFQAALAHDAGIVPVLITASPGILAHRLASRGRESASTIAQRIARGGEESFEHPRLAVIDNSGAIAESRRNFVALLSRIAETAPAL